MLARLSRDRFATGTMEVNHLSEAYRYNYGINTNVTLMSSNYILNVGVRRDLASRALSVSQLLSVRTDAACLGCMV